MNFKWTILLLAAPAVCALLYSPALAEQRLREFEGAPFSVGAQRQIAVRLLPIEAQAGFGAAAAMPPGITGMELIEFRWPKSDRSCVLAVGSAAPAPQAAEPPRSYLTLVVGDQCISLPAELAAVNGFISRVAVWPTTSSESADLVMLYSIGEGGADSRLFGIVLTAALEVQAVDCGSARTLYGWFDLIDFDDDGAFELLTTRSLDGVDGGFTFHAVRAYDATARTYRPQPDAFKPYFERELTWLSWVLETRAKIQADPAPYLNPTQLGHVYVASYENVQYGFDSIIEVPATFTGVTDVKAYNAERRKAFTRISGYRDQLQAWLEGGAYPELWGLKP